MITVGAFEAKTNLSRLIDQVAHGEQVTITRHGVPVARIVSIGPQLGDRAAAVERLRSLSFGVTLDGVPVRELITEGRRY